MRFPGVHAVATTPAQGLGACFAHFPSPIRLPRSRSRVGLRIVLFEACSAFTRVTACTLALSPIRDTLHQRLQPFRYLHSCSGCFRLERLPGGTFTHWESAAFARRTLQADIQVVELFSWLPIPLRPFFPPHMCLGISSLSLPLPLEDLDPLDHNRFPHPPHFSPFWALFGCFYPLS